LIEKETKMAVINPNEEFAKLKRTGLKWEQFNKICADERPNDYQESVLKKICDSPLVSEIAIDNSSVHGGLSIIGSHGKSVSLSMYLLSNNLIDTILSHLR
jgi:hypothetical protein